MDRSINIWATLWAIALALLVTRVGVGQDAIGIEIALDAAAVPEGQAEAETKGEGGAKEIADDTIRTTEPYILRLINGDYVAGKLVESPAGAGIVWQSPAFQETLRVPYERVNAIVSSSPEVVAPDLPAKYRLELAGGDVLFGDLISFDQDKLVLAESDSRRVQVAVSAVRKLSRTEGAPGTDCIGVGLIKDWKTSGPKNAWQEDAGVVHCKSIEGVARRSVDFHPQSRVELQVSWKAKPRFKIALMAHPGDAGGARAYRLEGWRDQIVLVHETEEGASITPVQTGLTDSGELAVQILIDHEKGQVFVLANDGKKLAELAAAKSGPETKATRTPKAKVNRIFAGQGATTRPSETPDAAKGKSKPPGSDIVLSDFSNNVRIESLRVSRWTGTMDVAIDAAGKFAVRTADGRRLAVQSIELKADTGEFTLVTPEGSSTLALQDILEIARQPDADDAVGRAFVAQLRSGARVSGELERIDDRHVWLKCPGLLEAYPCELQSLIAIKRVAQAEKTKEAETKPRLELGGLILHGQLTESAVGSPLRWQAEGCQESVSLRPGLSGRIVLHDRPPPSKKTTANTPQGPGMVTQVTRFFGLGRAPGSKNASAAHPALVHLREGDVIPCRVKHMNDRGVEIESSLVAATFIPKEKIRVVELDPKAAAIGIPKDKKDRLLMLPRAQRNNAPTHLIRSTRGDYLRGRLLEMDESKLAVELRLETQVIPVDRVARVIWLHKDETAQANTPSPMPPATGLPGERTQVVFPDGNRLSFQAESFAQGTLHGTSSLLGAIHAKVAEVDRILFGTAIDKEASELPFHSWKLRSAPDPLDVASSSASDAGPPPGSESPLVGKPAPDIELDLLDGGKFELKKLRGKVVVLDFWATWCGPCLRSTPLIEKVVGEAGDGVQLIAVNLQETPTKIQKMLDRLELKLTTALDRDGLIAEKYGAASIPHIVVINREGVVARVYEGVSSDFEQKLRMALKTVAEGKPEAPKAPETSATPAATSTAPEDKTDESKGETPKDAAQ